ncbi:hypothetical protein OH76DRAFT_456344 [Lentinus brumalis]|uniref:Uncharacterized protein n=1 Tax=Lentinus brumalis TaxID=2498619 RepID=A0A371DDE1_9APHY|nr:hypothetical protein OH76DRAFT_456344 [Polyporus brumalis]
MSHPLFHDAASRQRRQLRVYIARLNGPQRAASQGACARPRILLVSRKPRWPTQVSNEAIYQDAWYVGNNFKPPCVVSSKTTLHFAKELSGEDKGAIRNDEEEWSRRKRSVTTTTIATQRPYVAMRRCSRWSVPCPRQVDARAQGAGHGTADGLAPIVHTSKHTSASGTDDCGGRW